MEIPVKANLVGLILDWIETIRPNRIVDGMVLG